MSTEDELLTFCLLKFDELTELVVQLGDDAANTAPRLPGANSPVAILRGPTPPADRAGS